MVEFWLVIVFLSDMEKYKPYVVAPFKDRSECVQAAEKNNHEKKDFLEELESGATFTCLRLERLGV